MAVASFYWIELDGFILQGSSTQTRRSRYRMLHCMPGCVLSCVLLYACPTLRAATEPEPENQDLFLEAIQSISEGRKTDASAILNRMLAKEPQHAGAWLDLALIQCQLGHEQEALRLFAAIEQRFNPPAVILDVINRQRQQGCAPAKRQSHFTLTAARGYDQNVNQGASTPNFTLGSGSNQVQLQLSPEFLPRPDHYSVLAADYSQEITHNGGLGFIQFQARNNDQLHRFNNISLALGAEQAWHWHKWSGRATGLLGFLSLGGQLYQRQTQLQLRANPPLHLPERWQLGLSSGISYVQYLTLSNFNATTLDLRSQLAYQSPQFRFSASASYLIDHAISDRPGGDRKGWLSSVQWQKLLWNDNSAELAISRQSWRGKSAYSANIINQPRNQETWILRSNLQIPIKQHQTLQLEWRQIWNRENISIYQYRDRQLQLSWQWQQ
jgi:hypothetical protein